MAGSIQSLLIVNSKHVDLKKKIVFFSSIWHLLDATVTDEYKIKLFHLSTNIKTALPTKSRNSPWGKVWASQHLNQEYESIHTSPSKTFGPFLSQHMPFLVVLKFIFRICLDTRTTVTLGIKCLQIVLISTKFSIIWISN